MLVPGRRRSMIIAGQPDVFFCHSVALARAYGPLSLEKGLGLCSPYNSSFGGSYSHCRLYLDAGCFGIRECGLNVRQRNKLIKQPGLRSLSWLGVCGHREPLLKRKLKSNFLVMDVLCCFVLGWIFVVEEYVFFFVLNLWIWFYVV